MRSANIITVASATLAAAGSLNGAGLVPPAVSRHVETVLTYSPRHISPRSSMSVDSSVAAYGCADTATCDDAAPSVSEAERAPLESSTHCICFSNAEALVARAPNNETSSRRPEVTGGAIPQQMQASMAGLLGFFIMCLVML